MIHMFVLLQPDALNFAQLCQKAMKHHATTAATDNQINAGTRSWYSISEGEQQISTVSLTINAMKDKILLQSFSRAVKSFLIISFTSTHCYGIWRAFKLIDLLISWSVFNHFKETRSSWEVCNILWGAWMWENRMLCHSRGRGLGFLSCCTFQQWHLPLRLCPQTECSSCGSWRETRN